MVEDLQQKVGSFDDIVPVLLERPIDAQLVGLHSCIGPLFKSAETFVDPSVHAHLPVIEPDVDCPGMLAEILRSLSFNRSEAQVDPLVDRCFILTRPPGQLPLGPEIMAYHKARLEERAKTEKRAITFQMVTDDIYAISKGKLIGRPR